MNGGEAILEEMMAENFPELRKDQSPQDERVFQVHSKIKTKNPH